MKPSLPVLTHMRGSNMMAEGDFAFDPGNEFFFLKKLLLSFRLFSVLIMHTLTKIFPYDDKRYCITSLNVRHEHVQSRSNIVIKKLQKHLLLVVRNIIWIA